VTPDARELTLVLRRIARRLGAASAVRTISRAAAAAASGMACWALATLALPLPFPMRAAGAVVAAGLAGALPVLLWWHRPSLLVAARAADRRLGLADRLGTAVDLLRRPGSPRRLACLQIAGAVESARALVPRDVAPLRLPRETWVAAGMCVLLVLWAQFLAGLTLPQTPAARTLVAIHREGEALEQIGRHLDAAARSQGLLETRRAATRVADLGHRLTAPRIDRQKAATLLREADRNLAATQEMVERRLTAAFPGAARAPEDRSPPSPGSGAQRLRALDQAVRQIKAATGQLQSGGAPLDRATLSRTLAALSESLDQMGTAPGARSKVEAARRDAELGRFPQAAAGLGEALEDIRAIERMLGDEQALGEARGAVQRSAEKIEQSGSVGASSQTTPLDRAGDTRPQSAGPQPPEPGGDEALPPPPGPNQGSLPGQGTGRILGAPTPRLEGKHVPAHISGIPGEGPSSLKEIVAPGQPGAPRIPLGRPPADVAHEIDRTLSREPLPAVYLDMIRRYFETLGGSP
jgi:hypothetical protein